MTLKKFENFLISLWLNLPKPSKTWHSPFKQKNKLIPFWIKL